MKKIEEEEEIAPPVLLSASISLGLALHFVLGLVARLVSCSGQWHTSEIHVSPCPCCKSILRHIYVLALWPMLVANTLEQTWANCSEKRQAQLIHRRSSQQSPSCSEPIPKDRNVTEVVEAPELVGGWE